MQYGDRWGKLNKSRGNAHIRIRNNVDVYEFIYHVVEILYIEECYYQLPKYRRMNYK